MYQTEEHSKNFAAVCGLYCRACSWFIASTEEPKRLKRLAAEMKYSEKESKCYGCRSDNKLPYCKKCKMFHCAAERGISFCSDCDEYPCTELKQFQSAKPHRIEIWCNLSQIHSNGYKNWLKTVSKNYTCPQCQTINSTYDKICRKCGHRPSCKYVEKHKQAIEHHLKANK